MPTTATGTTYTVRTITLGSNVIYWAVDDTRLGDTDIPLVVYAHGNTGAANQFSAFGAWQGTREWLIDNGYAYVECTGGGLSSWGNQQARDDYEQAVAYVMTQIDVSQIVPLGRSMGGIVSYWLYTHSTLVEPLAAGLIINSGVTDLTAWLGPYPGYADYRTPLGILADGSNYNTVLDSFDPMRQPEADWDGGKKVLQLWGTADTTVPPAVHAQAWITKYGSHLSKLDTDIRDGGDHTQANGSYLQTAAMTAFLFEVTGVGPEPIVETDTYKIIQAYRVGEYKRLYPMALGG